MKNRGFTLVELLAATVLSTLLFVTALSVIRGLSRVTPGVGSAPAPAVRRLLEWDLENAAVFRRDDRGLVLAGYGSMDAGTRLPNHLPVRVVYSVRTIGGRRWLVREQAGLDPLLPGLDFTEPVCADVKSFTLTGSYALRTETVQDAAGADEDPTPVIFQQQSGMQRVPDRVRVRLELQTDPVPVIDSVLYLR